MKNAARLFALVLLSSAAGPALAHVGIHAGSGAHDSFAAGLAHPLSGVDHMLAAFAVGLWASMGDARERWLLPSTFVSMMALAAMLGAHGTPFTFGDASIAATLVILGLLAAAAVRAPTLVAAGLVALAGFLHGYAHGSEGGAAPRFIFGLIAATAALHAAGVAFGTLTRLVRVPLLARAAGAAVAAAGVVLVALP
jgi:urease accessory protein